MLQNLIWYDLDVQQTALRGEFVEQKSPCFRYNKCRHNDSRQNDCRQMPTSKWLDKCLKSKWL